MQQIGLIDQLYVISLLTFLLSLSSAFVKRNRTSSNVSMTNYLLPSVQLRFVFANIPMVDLLDESSSLNNGT